MAEKKLGFSLSKETAWCPGCGNFGIQAALGEALNGLDVSPNDVLFVSGIGQAGKTPHYIRGNVLNTLHGRTLPTATGAKLANSQLTVIAMGGDGDGYAEGGNHFIHALRKNINITYLVHDNRVFGLTKGQASPLSHEGMVTGTTPQGNTNEAFNPLAMAITLNGGFVARSYSANKEHLVKIIQAAVQYPGFALIDVLQPCVTFNKLNTYQWYRSRVYDLAEDEEYDNTNRTAAWERSWEWGDTIPIGVFYQVERKTLDNNTEIIKDMPLVHQTAPDANVSSVIGQFLVK